MKSTDFKTELIDVYNIVIVITNDFVSNENKEKQSIRKMKSGAEVSSALFHNRSKKRGEET